MSYARKVKAQKLAAHQAQNADEQIVAGLSEYDKMLQKLNSHRAELKSIDGTDFKIARKREFIDEYDDYVDAVLENGTGAQDDVCLLYTSPSPRD